MSQLGRLHDTLLRRNGVPAADATVEVRRQGATVITNASGSSPLQIEVADTGAIAVSDTLAINLGAGTYNVDSIDNATHLTISGFVGTLAVTAGDRLSPTNTLVSLWEDNQGNNAGPNPMTTDERGEFAAWTDSSPYDLLVTGGGFGTRLFVDVWPAGIALVRVNAKNQGTGIIFDVRGLPSTGKIIGFYLDGTEVFAVNADGTITGTVAISVPDPLTLQNGLTVNGITTLNNGAGILGGLTVDNFTGTGTFAVAAGAIASAALAAHAVSAAPSTTLGSASDVVLTTSDAVLATASYTPVGTNSVVFTVVNAQYKVGASTTNSAFGTLTLFIDGVSAVLQRFGIENIDAGGDTIQQWCNVSFVWITTGLSNAAHTFELRHKKTDVDGTGAGLTYKGTVSRATLSLEEFKK